MRRVRRTCVVCTAALGRGTALCAACCRSYDRNGEGDGSVLAAIVWAAKRARRFEAKRHVVRAPAAAAPDPRQRTIEDRIREVDGEP